MGKREGEVKSAMACKAVERLARRVGDVIGVEGVRRTRASSVMGMLVLS